MTPAARDSLIGFWREIERQGGKPTAATVIALSRKLMGHKIRDTEAYKLLSNFRQRPGQIRAVFGQRKSLVVAESGQSSGRVSTLLRARVRGITLYKADSTVVESTVETPVEPPPPPAKKRTPRQPALGLDRQETIAAAEMCAALWKLIQDVTPGITQTSWRTRQMRVARDMVQAGITQETFLAAVQTFRDARGYYPKQMAWVQEFIARGAQPKKSQFCPCGCGNELDPRFPVPRNLSPTDVPHYAGDGDWIIGNTFDPKPFYG